MRQLNESRNLMKHPYQAQNAYPINPMNPMNHMNPMNAINPMSHMNSMNSMNFYPQYSYQGQQMPHQMNPQIQPSMHRQMAPNHDSVNYGNQHHYQAAGLYNQILPANISVLNLSHEQSSINSLTQANQIHQQMKSMRFNNNQQNLMNSSHNISSNSSFNYEKFGFGRPNNVLNRTAGFKK